MGAGGTDDDDDVRGRLLPPDDRLWIHPSELVHSMDGRRAPNMATMVLSAVGGALVVGALWFTFGGSTRVTLATERVSLIPIESLAPRITPADEWTRVVADVARPSTAAVRRLGSTVVVAVAVAIRDDGYMVTSGRAIGGAETVMIITGSGTAQMASVIGTDPTTDLSVLRVNDHMAAAVTSDEEPPEFGETLALVDPYGNPQSRIVMSRAATSATSDGDLLVGVIALDSSIGDVLPGSPAVDMTGAIVGIIASTAEDAPTAVVPVSLVRSVAHSLITDGQADHPRAGVSARDVMPSDSTGQLTGALVTSVEANGPAAESGMLVGDVVIQVGPVGITSMAAMVAELMTHRPGETVDFLVIRGGHEVVCHVLLDTSASTDR